MTTVERRTNISYKEFIEEYQNKGIPVVLENATEAWPSRLMFTPEYFRANFGDHITKHENREYTMSEILDITATSTTENPAPYPIKFNLLTQLPEVLTHMNPLHLNLMRPNWLSSKIYPKNKLGNSIDLFIGGPGNYYSVHKDAYDVHAWLIQLYGEKEIIMYPRDQESLLYPGKGGIMESRSPINISNPDYEKYPKYKKATPLSITLKAGEVIYIPNGIWHTTKATVHNISIIIDQVNNSNYKAWRRDIYIYKKDYSKFRASMDYLAATAIGNICRLGQLLGKKY
jgi:histone arginine demethylase JMJD6